MPIPVDIVERVIEILAQDDPNRLSTKACSLVCRDFLDFSRKHIFASIILNDTYNRFPLPSAWNIKATTPMFERLLSITPDIANHIRSLIYIITADDFKNLSLIPTFQQITSLRSLTIWHHSRDQPQWNNNPLRPALLHLLHVPTLTHFQIASVNNFVLADMIPCVNLKHFKLDRLMIFKIEDIFPSNLPQNSLRLHKITAGTKSVEAISKLCVLRHPNGKPFIDFGTLTSVSVAMSNLDEVEASQILFGCCEQLIDATISIQNIKMSLNGLSRMVHPSLQTLKHLSVQTIYSLELSNDPLSGLASELEKIRKHNVIETVAINISISTDSDAPRGDEWGMLDKVLARPGWSKLRRVSLDIVIYQYMPEYDGLEEALKNLAEKQFMYLTSNKFLVFEFAMPKTDGSIIFQEPLLSDPRTLAWSNVSIHRLSTVFALFGNLVRERVHDYKTWSNIPVHAFNAILALFEIAWKNVPTFALTDLPVTAAVLSGYLGIAYSM